jgi:4-hydroxy-tetrahydrodipicolinate synthase
VTDAPKTLGGVIAAALTPLKEDLSPDLDKMVRHCRWLLANGCDALGILGTTGEANSFSVDERIALFERLGEEGIPGTALLPGTGTCAIPDSVALTKAALKIGAAGVLMLPPFYYKNCSDEALAAAFSEVIERVGDARLRVYLYHFPQMSGVPITPGVIERLLAAYPGTVVGMKDSSGNLNNMVGAVHAFPGFAVFAGSDDLLLPLLKQGGAGCITAAANVACSLAKVVYTGWRSGGVDDANARLVAVRRAVVQHPLIPALKELMARHTGDAAWTTLRPPNMRLPEAKRRELLQAFDAIGLTLPAAA